MYLPLCPGCVPPEPEEGELLQGKRKGSVGAEGDGYLGNPSSGKLTLLISKGLSPSPLSNWKQWG